MKVSQPTRHARTATGDIVRRHVDALIGLDGHPALRALHDQYLDRTWRRAHVLDQELREHAYRYLDLIGETEADRRAELIGDYLPIRPKDLAMANDPQECPVCDRTALLVDALDDFGEGVGSGTCLVCSYERSPVIAYWAAADIRIARLANDE